MTPTLEPKVSWKGRFYGKGTDDIPVSQFYNYTNKDEK